MESLKDIRNADPERLLTKVYTDNFSWLQGYILKNSGTLEDAADVFQEGVSAAWLNLRAGKFRGDAEQFNAYVRQICKYKWINQLKSAGRTRLVLEGDLSSFEGEADDAEVWARQLEQNQRLNASIARIGEKCRELLGRFYFQRQSLAKIAGAMNNTEDSIKTIKYRCMMRLRKIYLEKQHNDE